MIASTYKHDFIDFMIRSGVLTFGDFVTKSGRPTPYFINSGNYNTGRQVKNLGEYYARAIRDSIRSEFDNIFGPAYKGIPLAVVTAAALWDCYSLDISFTFNRKEAKDHGEQGRLVGHQYNDGERVIIVEDVVNAGTSIHESVALLREAAYIRFVGIVVAVDRMERGRGEQSALVEIQEEMGIRTFAIVTIREVVDYLHGREIDGRIVIDDEMAARIDAHLFEFGAG